MILVLSDLHLSDNPLEEYRWGVFDWVNDDLMEKYNFDSIIILGDLTEKKDNHSAKLVNRLVAELNYLANKTTLLILRGNHDGLDPEWPFFGFLRNNSNIDYFYEPTITDDAIWLPHSRDPVNDWKDILTKKNLKGKDYIFMHQTMKGAVANNGFKLVEGFDPVVFNDFTGLVLSGDIHKPQKIGELVYVGSPYPVYFGDDFAGGALILHDEGKVYERIEYKTISRVMLDLDLTKDQGFHFTVKKGDQFKVRLLVNRSDSDKYDKFKKSIRDGIVNKGGVVVSMELKLNVNDKINTLAKKRKFKDTNPETVLNRFAKVEGLDEFYISKGKEFLI